MKKAQKQMIREMSQIVTEDIIKMIENVEAVQKKAEKAERKARRKKYAKQDKVMRKADKEYSAYLLTLDDDAEPIAQWELEDIHRGSKPHHNSNLPLVSLPEGSPYF